MPQPSTRQPGLPPTAYYAPTFKIEVEDKELDPKSNGDVLEIKVVMDLDNLTRFDLTLNNWDDGALDFKYSDKQLFTLGNQVHVQMGYADRLLSIVKGEITGLAPQFPESGPPTLTVSGHGALVKLRDRKPGAGEAKKFVNMADWEIAQAIASRNSLRIEVTREGPRHDQVIQKNQDDARFLMERAKRIDFDFYGQTDAETSEEVLFFVKPFDRRDASPAKVYVFEWGKSLISFSPQLTTARQVGKVTVRGWDSRTKQAIRYTAGPEDLPASGGQGQSGPQVVDATQRGKEDVVVDAPVASEEEAKALAISLLRERAYGFNTGSGQVIGLPDLRPGNNVELWNLGTRFSGSYYVTKVEHTLGSSGYLTRFDVRRPHDGGIAA